MKKLILISISIILIGLLSCENEGNMDNKGVITNGIGETDSIETEVIINEEIDEVLEEFLNTVPDIKTEFELYIEKIREDIKSEEQLIEIFALRDSLIKMIEEPLTNYFDGGHESDSFYENLEKLHESLKKYGFLCIYAEGMMVGLDRAEILTEEIEKTASEPYKLFLDFKQAHANSMGGEYPFMSLDNEVDVVKYGEKLTEKYPQHKYTKEIRDQYITSVSNFTDFHKVIRDENEEYFNMGLSTDYYPFASSKDNFELFVKELPKSKFTPMVKKILDNTSEIELVDDSYDIVYLVMTDSVGEYNDASTKVFNYLSKGFDVPHYILLKQDEISFYAVVYRFYTDITKAEQALDRIEGDFREARIVKVNSKGEVIN